MKSHCNLMPRKVQTQRGIRPGNLKEQTTSKRIFFKDTMIENHPYKPEMMMGATNRPPDNPEHTQTDKRQSQPTLFENQFAQRRKRARLDRQEAAQTADRRPDTTNRQTAKSRQTLSGRSRQNVNLKVHGRTANVNAPREATPS